MRLEFDTLLFIGIRTNMKTPNYWGNDIDFNIGRIIELEIISWLEHGIK
jgi:altronate dehydratase